MTWSGYSAAMSRAKSHCPPLASILSTARLARARISSSIRLKLAGMNQLWVSLRYAMCSGASRVTSERTRCGLPPVILLTMSPLISGPSTTDLGALRKRALSLLILRISACRVIAQNGRYPSTSTTATGVSRRKMAKIRCSPCHSP